MQDDIPFDLPYHDLGNPELRRGVAAALSIPIRLNGENVEFRWEGWEELNALPGLAPGLKWAFERLVDQWIEEKSLGTD